MRRVYQFTSWGLESSERWASALTACAGLGFDTVLISLPRHNLFEDAITPDVDLPGLIKLAAKQSLQVIVEGSIGSVYIGSAEADRLGLSKRAFDARDPRLHPKLREMLPIPFSDEGKAKIWLEAVKRRLEALKQMGAEGVCFPLDQETPSSIWSAISSEETSKLAPISRWAFLDRLDRQPEISSAGFVGAFLPVNGLFDLKNLGRLSKIREIFGDVVLTPSNGAPRPRDLANWDEPTLEQRLKFLLWTSAALADGILLPMGFEYGLAGHADAWRSGGEWSKNTVNSSIDLTNEIVAVNAFLSKKSDGFKQAPLTPIWSNASGGLAVLRHSIDRSSARVILANPSLEHPLSVPASEVSREAGEYLPLRDVLRSEPNIQSDAVATLQPGQVSVFDGQSGSAIRDIFGQPRIAAEQAVKKPRLIIEAASPYVDNGRYAVKRIVGDVVHVEADVFGEGHDPIAVAMLWRAADEEQWREKRMRPLGNDRWTADFPLDRLGRYFVVIEAWRDEFAVFRYELQKKHDAGLALALELKEGELLLQRSIKPAKAGLAAGLETIVKRLRKSDDAGRLAILLAPETSETFSAADPRLFPTRLDPPIVIDSERKIAGFASWYELFPRSQSGDPARHGVFADVVRRLPAIRDMGFDVVYFPPIHPIGVTNRKGRNNTLRAGPDDPGSPYAIGSAEGGHDAIHPALGSFEDFAHLLSEAKALGLEIAIDFAIQASPDHPWLKQHPEWFDWRPDGSIRYAENPPKKYEDIVNVDFYTEGAKPALWLALRDVIKFWVEKGIALFRIDNPHTKPFPFWDWVIADIRREHPEVVFLAEAFTRPKVMYRLAKGGFSQSYTYFTWRNTKFELQSYFTELAQEAPKDFFRPHLFVNTPDINPDFLQNAPRSAYLIRAALATTLSGLWGMYNGFEICEGRPDISKKEYADSEKYQIRKWDWDRPGNIIAEITALNRARRENPALHSHLGVSFLYAGNDNILYFEKATPSRTNVLLVAVSLDPYAAQEADVEIPLWKFGMPDHGSIAVEDLIRGHRFSWTGKYQRVRIDPQELPFSIWRMG